MLVTHYQRLLNYIVPDYVHVMEAGRIIKTGGKELALELEARGYDWVSAECKASGGCGGMNAAVDQQLSRGPARGAAAMPASPSAWLERPARARGRARRRADGADHARRGLALHRHIAADEDSVPAGARARHGSARPTLHASRCPKRRRGWCSSTASTRRSCRSTTPVSRSEYRRCAALTRHGAAIADRISAGTRRSTHNAFAALNTAFLHDGALIVVPRERRGRGADASAVRRDAARGGELSALPGGRGAGSAVTVVEDFVALHGRGLFHQCGDRDSRSPTMRSVPHVRVQREGAQAFHIAHCAVSLAHASRYQSVQRRVRRAHVALQPRTCCRRPKAPNARSTDWR